MKHLLITVLLAVSLLAYAEEEKKQPVITTPKGWNTNLAKVQAEAKNKPDAAVAVLFAGADQIKLQKEVLETPAFARFAQRQLVLAYVPLPKPPPKQQEAQEGGKSQPPKPDPAALLRAKYKVAGTNCTMILMDVTGKEIGRLNRIEPAADYILRMQRIMAPVPEIIRIARSNNLKNMAKYLEEHPEDVNRGDAFGSTAVTEAVRRNNIKMLELLFSKKADPNRKGDGGLSPIMIWSQRNQPKPVLGELLLKNGAAVNARDDMGRTALMIAIQANAINTATFLCANGARMEAADKKGETALMYAIRRKNPAMITLLLKQKGNRILQQDNNGNTALHIAATVPGMTPQIIQLLLQNGAHKSSRNNKRQTPFAVAKDANIKKLLKP